MLYSLPVSGYQGRVGGNARGGQLPSCLACGVPWKHLVGCFVTQDAVWRDLPDSDPARHVFLSFSLRMEGCPDSPIWQMELGLGLLFALLVQSHNFLLLQKGYELIGLRWKVESLTMTDSLFGPAGSLVSRRVRGSRGSIVCVSWA